MDSAGDHDAEILKLLLGMEQDGTLGILQKPALGQDAGFDDFRRKGVEQGAGTQQRKILGHGITSLIVF